MRLRGGWRPPGGAAVGASERLPVGRVDLRPRRGRRSPGGAAVGARERLPVGRGDVRVRGGGRPPRGAEVGARERLPVGRGDVRVRGGGRPPRGAEVGARERLPVGRGDVRVAAEGGHLEVLQWARANGCPWDEETCAYAARGRPPRGAEVGGTTERKLRGTAGKLAPTPRKAATWRMLQWARANGAPWDNEGTCAERRGRRPPGGAPVGARERRSVARDDLRPLPRYGGHTGGAAVGARE